MVYSIPAAHRHADKLGIARPTEAELKGSGGKVDKGSTAQPPAQTEEQNLAQVVAVEKPKEPEKVGVCPVYIEQLSVRTQTIFKKKTPLS